MWLPPRRSASTRLSVDLPLDPELAQDGGGDFLDRLAGRVDAAYAFAAHQVLGFLDLVAAVIEVGVAAVRAPLLADLVQPLGCDGEAVEPPFVGAQRLRQLHALEILGNQGVICSLDPGLEREG